MRYRGIGLAVAGLALSATMLAAQATPAAPTAPIQPVGNEIELGRKFTQWLFTAQFDSLFAHADAEGQQTLGRPEEMQAHLDELVATLGEESEVIEEKVVMRNGKPQYWRTSTYTMAPEPFMLRWVIVKGQILGIGLNPASRAPAIDPPQ